MYQDGKVTGHHMFEFKRQEEYRFMANPLKLLKLKATGFQFIQETPIDAPPKKVWLSLLNFDKWFGFEPPVQRPKSILEVWPGGRWFTEAKDGTANLNMIVTRIEPRTL